MGTQRTGSASCEATCDSLAPAGTQARAGRDGWNLRFLTVYPEIRTSWAMQDAQLGQFDPRLEVCPRNQRLKALEQPQLDTDLVAREFLRLANETNLPGRFRLNSRRLQHLGHSEYSTAPPDSQSAPDVYKHGLSKIRLEGAHSL